ncbi:unnamed protein product (macronuclear) [Paramecium tetraurelia]|uniref:Uncharacterized protein n=1 Tax=Paramecium tetraurelia TaxID=5888 RepID=A0DLK1_PARTE|nr:uncharacterized protein GSPATT00018235001 [Paramecium tetraurelia]CAK83918.1 unnamed protein product [Paramecium tetraurelia]|eukprot:XP_001451315.1 hypothetical protein (macronuclear) [Paramecium tetraurelia strain d4-2]
MLFLLISIALAQQLEYFNDANFQKRTLISKHYVVYDWVIAFCDQECAEETITVVNSFPDSYQKGLVNLQTNPWIKDNIAQKGIWIYHLNNTMCEFKNGNCHHHLQVPQIYNIPKVNFFESRMIVVQIGCVILVVFYIMAFFDLKKRFWDTKHKVKSS